MDTKPVFDGFLEAFRSENFCGLIFLQPGTVFFFLWELGNVPLLNANDNFQYEFALACCQVLVFILPNKTKQDQLSAK